MRSSAVLIMVTACAASCDMSANDSAGASGNPQSAPFSAETDLAEPSDASAGTETDSDSDGAQLQQRAQAPESRVLSGIPPILRPTIQVGTQSLATGLGSPLFATSAPGIANRLFVVDQVGTLWRVDTRSGAKDVYLDVRSLLVELGLPALNGYDERGFLGLAFHPEFATNGLLYTYTSEPVKGRADFTYPKLGNSCPTAPGGLGPDHQNVLREWRVLNPSNSNSLPEATSREVLRVDWGNYNHNGGMLAFGPDGMLYVSLGDGGGEDDQTCQIGGDKKPTIGHSAQGNAQDPGLIYGKVIRIDPMARTSANGHYGIPSDNAFAFASGYLPEIHALGLRNFWRYSFDPKTGALIGNDVGQNNIEELDVIRAGGNYGWRAKEGTAAFDPAGFSIDGATSDGIARALTPGVPPNLIDPIAQYAHTRGTVHQGRASIGGFVYRGTAIPELAGHYVFGDYTQREGMLPAGRILTLVGLTDSQLEALATGSAPTQTSFRIASLIDRPLPIFTLGFGQDESYELYVLGNVWGTPSGQTGQILRLVRVLPSDAGAGEEAGPEGGQPIDAGRDVTTADAAVDAGDAGRLVPDAGQAADATTAGDAAAALDAGDAGAVVEAGGDAGAVVEAGGDAGAVVEAGGDAGAVVEAGGDAGPIGDGGAVPPADAESPDAEMGIPSEM